VKITEHVLKKMGQSPSALLPPSAGAAPFAAAALFTESP